ncbi:MAG TPA: FHA domain-containing protein [Anaerolineales bacterium]|nr:FHA domain-containing protein [Anaerolineales bacterium]
MRKLLAFFLSLGLLAATQAFAHAQTAAYAEIAWIDASNFPQISALLDVYDAEGTFMAGLQPSNLTAYEDGQPRVVDTLIETAAPVQIVVAINPGPGLAVRDGNGVARFDKVVQALNDWANAQPADSGDNFSLISLTGSLINHATLEEWLVSLNAFKPDFRNTTPNLQTLDIALDTALAPTPQPGMKRAVLFITPRMNDPAIDSAIAPYIRRAVDSKVRVFVWFVDAEETHTSASANAFKSLALQTDGEFFTFSGREPFPDLTAYFTPLRSIYLLTYTSAITTPGDHTLGIYVETPQATIPAADKTFSVNVQPPNPIFVSPPLQITRQPPVEDPYNAEVLEPAEQVIEIIIEFADGHKRDLRRTALYVDGNLVAENTSEPFDRFVWDLSAYDRTAQHEIIVEAEDMLGLKKSSIGIPVTITVIHPPRGIRALFARYQSYIILGSILLAGMALMVILIRSGGSTRQRSAKPRRAIEDPVTQPVAALTEPLVSATKKSKTQPRFTGWMPSKNPRMPEAPAYLIRLTNGGEPASVAPIPLHEKETTFGTDPVQSMYVLDDPSISPLHARIKQVKDGVFVIYDHGSVAGTWVNYEPVPREGVRLAHGDRIHFGRRMYRFDLKQAPAESEPKVIRRK